jgi:hypothetical protein
VFSSHLKDEFRRFSDQLAEQRKSLPAVTTSLALAAGIGLMETVALVFGSGTLIDFIGIPMVCRTSLLSRLNILYLLFGTVSWEYVFSW